ncbi:hypothetical protein EDC14_1004151 [Hydrogenispora ethanolica]|uniref:Uncharacterized protein n=1 Tax=Hydrogenispora ethanolica TaxID=1082276 RepID=A0A4R1S4J9_HYDET|nr:hypothetical protein [Hydrogenispora ethanolica]TCL74213.1 hypothetical protein EDC14_1004151 [Hydrogenispora ethanolica]
MLNLYCTKCGKEIEKCNCTDLYERFKKKFWGASIYDVVMARVAVKGREKAA